MASLRRAVRRATPYAATARSSSVRGSITPGGSVVATGFPEGMASSPMPASHYNPKRIRRANRRSTNY